MKCFLQLAARVARSRLVLVLDMSKKKDRHPEKATADRNEPSPLSPPIIIIRQKRSLIGRPQDQREALQGLGLRRIGHEVERQNTPAVRGQIRKIPHLVEIVGFKEKPEEQKNPADDHSRVKP